MIKHNITLFILCSFFFPSRAEPSRIPRRKKLFKGIYRLVYGPHDSCRLVKCFTFIFLFNILTLLFPYRSSSIEQAFDYPVRALFRFFHNHCFYQIAERPEWRTVKGGSRLAALDVLFLSLLHLLLLLT